MAWKKYTQKESDYFMNKTFNLAITNITTKDEGYYSCTVENVRNQRDHKSMYLFVKPLSLLGGNYT